MKQPSRWRIAQNCLHLLEEVYLLDRFPPQTTRNELATPAFQPGVGSGLALGPSAQIHRCEWCGSRIDVANKINKGASV